MRKRNLGKRIMGLVLALMMMATMVPMDAFAKVGDLKEGKTGLSGNISTENPIKLPIKIYDYLNDGMLFEYAETVVEESKENQWLRKENVSKPTASIMSDFTIKNNDCGAVAFSGAEFTTGAADKGNKSSLTYLNWSKNNESACLSVFDRSQEGFGATRYQLSAIRYLTLVYRSTGGNAATTAQFDMWNYTDNVRTSKTSVTYDNRGTAWRYMVVDLNETNMDLTDSATAVYGYMPSGTGVAFAAYFADQTEAEAFGKAAVEYTGTTYHNLGDNRAYGLLRWSRNKDYESEAIGNTYKGTSVNYTKSPIDTYLVNTYDGVADITLNNLDLGGYKILADYYDSGISTAGMLESTLSEDGYLVYKESTVAYLADILQKSLAIPKVDPTTGYLNYGFVQGEASDKYGGIDLAQWLRNHCTELGTYARSADKNLVGTWEECSGNIQTYFDAAYFLLNSISVPGSYNIPQDDYGYLALSKAVTDDGEDTYVFDGGFATSATPSEGVSAVKYDKETDTISNTSALGKTEYVHSVDANGKDSGQTTYYPFLPITDGNNASGQTKSPYFLDPGVASTTDMGNTYKNRNFNYVVVTNGQFVYHKDDDLYFEFEGDDDVYLFVNGQLVLDIGGAHSITKEKIKINDYVEQAEANIKAGTATARDRALALVDGEQCDFDFYYMERHAVGANIRIETNIRVTDPAMNTEKKAYQDGVEIDYAGIVDKDKFVEYGFSIENKGEEILKQLAFSDDDIGVKINSTEGLVVNNNMVTDLNGEQLDASDLTAIVSHPEYEDKIVTFENNEALKNFMRDLTSDAVEKSGDGLWEKSKVLIRGIGYTLTNQQINEGKFQNIVHSSAVSSTQKALAGEAKMLVYVPADPMYYEWAGHDLEVSKTKLIGDIMSAASAEGNILPEDAAELNQDNVNKIELVTKAGTAISSNNVVINDNNLTVNYPNAGSKVFYVKITYNSSKSVIIPVLVNVTAVKDNVFVLDYGLKVDLTEGNALIKEDTVVVPGRSTSTSIIGIGSEGAYSPNEITFSKDADGIIKNQDADGTFTLNGQTLTYTPDAFMEAVDTIQVAMNVYENDITPSNIGVANDLDINNEVEMYKNIRVLPANVVYYEDDFPAIKYADTDNDDATTTQNVFTRVGDSATLTQSADQSIEYGKDAVYADGANTEKSGGTLTTIEVKDSAKTAYFEFKGTGFELIGRTNAKDSATLKVRVKDSTGKIIKNIPVITEFDNGADKGEEQIYQVPVVRVKDLPYGAYTVEIVGVPAYDYTNNDNPTPITTYLYIDGLRIYQPMEAKDTESYYNKEEQEVSFVEIRDQIVEGIIAVSEWTGTDLTVASGLRTWTENYDGTNQESGIVANEVNTVDEYLLKGPNNEVYMMGDYVDAALLFYVKEDTFTEEEQKTREHELQIGVHAVDEGLFVGAESIGMSSTIKYGVQTGIDENEEPQYSWVTLDEVTSATEQYYTIDYTKCPKVGDAYQVVVLIEDGMASFTNLKTNGLILVEAPEVVEEAQVFMSLRSMMMTLNVEDDVTDDTTPDNGEDTTTPEEGEDTTTPDNGEDITAPEEDGDDTTSEENTKPSKPDKNGKDEKPSKPSNNGNNGNNKNPAKPNNNGNNTKPDKSNKKDNDTVVEEEETVTPDEDVTVVVPDKDEVVEVPEEDASESTSIWDMIWEFISGIFKFLGGVFAR